MASVPEFQKLIGKYERCEEILAERESRLHHFVRPILDLFRTRVGINKVRISGKNVYIDYGWSCKGCYDSNDITLPLWIFESANPLESAKTYKEDLEAAEKGRQKREKIEKIARLQKEIDEN